MNQPVSSNPAAGTPPQRRLFLIHGLTAGGSEKVAVELTAHWAASGYPTALVTLASANEDRFPIGPGVERIGLDCLGHSRGPLAAIGANRQRVRRIREAVREFSPDVVVSFNDRTNVLAALALRKRNFPLIVSERSDPRSRAREPLWSSLRRWTYPTADAVVIPSQGFRAWAEGVAKKAPVFVVPNACWSAKDLPEEAPRDAEREPIVLGMGRFDRPKGFDLLIEAFAQVAPRWPDWRLRLVGEGPEREALLRQAAEAGLGSQFEILPWASDPARRFREAKIFVLPSRGEGFPNVLVEAMAAGLATISFDCRSGPSDVIRPGHDGLLIETGDTFALAAALHRMIGDDAFRIACARRAQDVRERYSPASVFAKWEEVLRSATRRSQGERRA
ncbi:MAG TPA: glycosyltransferase family 4 protein [Pirellulaceae bacterium]|jgi:glycosyltransferase involved in cell wall biosynthesis|nr:glycosyltransferase family 4 protein [Pirellulaceae bacterium]